MKSIPLFSKVCRDLLLQIDTLDLQGRAKHDSVALFGDVMRILPAMNRKMHEIIQRKEGVDGINATIIVCHKLHSDQWIAKQIIESLGGVLPELKEDKTLYQTKLRAELFIALENILNRDGMEQFTEIKDEGNVDGMRETMIAITFNTVLEAFSAMHEEHLGTYMLDIYAVDTLALADDYVKSSNHAKTMMRSIYEDMGL